MSFVNIDIVRERYEEITDAYIEAFKGEPWREITLCADEKQRCAGGLSALEIGEMCVRCGLRPTEPAYRAEQLVETFETLNEQKALQWYLEDSDKGLNLAALAWRGTGASITEAKYPDDPDMGDWLKLKFGDQELVWLDEVFANKQNKRNGNLSNFADMCRGFGRLLGSQILAYRTLTPQMLEAAKRDFSQAAKLSRDMPDMRKRTFVTIQLGEGLI